MPDKFKELIKSLTLGEKKAISTVKKNLEIIVSQNFSKKYIELDWIAEKNEICSQRVLFDDLFSDLIQKIKHNRETISTFSEYKDFLISKANEKISKLFQNYFDLLSDNDEKAWSKFDTLLKKRIKFWLIKKGFTNIELHEQLYQDAQIVFLNKLQKKELNFKDSRLLKSYIFKTINFKLYEYQREKKEQLSIDEIDFEPDFSDNYKQVIPDLDKEKFIPNLFKDLNEFEKKILFEVYFKEEKHKDIAKKLNITEENCRVIKHRALAKLEKPASLYGYI